MPQQIRLVCYKYFAVIVKRKIEVKDVVMETVQIRLTDKQIKNIEGLVKKGVYPNRSEAVRDAVRRLVEESSE